MGIHYDYKSKEVKELCVKEAKRKARLDERKSKKIVQNKPKGYQDKMHDIHKPITLEDLTNPDSKKLILMKIAEKKEKSLLGKELALKSNLKKRKKFKEKYKIKKNNERFI